MKKTLLKQLILTSYKEGELDEEIVFAIADRLERKELKQYLKALKQSEKLRTVIVDLPTDAAKEQIKDLQMLFPQKAIKVRKDPSLLAGVRIINSDDIFEMNLKHNLDAIIEQVNED